MDSVSKVKARKINSYNNYINKIRFPKFKNFTKDMELTFDFPLTILTGPNGCGKTSVLQALYGSPNGYSISKFWFSTELDPIKDGDGEPNRFIYEYKPKGYNKKVEAIKKRVGTKKGNDYWETARPSKEDGMPSLSKEYGENEAKYRSDTRWSAVDKKVTYINFKEIISPFDKFMSYGDYTRGKTILSKQDFIRNRSKHLRSAVVFDKKVEHYKKKVRSIYNLEDKELEWVSKILGKEYTSAKVLDHDLFNTRGLTVIFEEADSKYSEALAGSGEVSVVTSVIRILKSPKDGLILLDEPEVSLHPSAQKSFRNLLLEKCYKDGCQVVLTTHSPFFLEDLPDAAIKTFYQDSNTRKQSVINRSSKDEAFIRIGSNRKRDKKIVFVEDDLAKLLFDKALWEINESLSVIWEAKVHPGGAETIKSNLLVDMIVHDADIKILLDGDKKRPVLVECSSNIPKSDYSNIDAILCCNTGVKNYRLPLDGGNASNAEQALDMKLKILDKYRKNISFIPRETPEEFLFEISGLNKSNYAASSMKDIFKEIAQEMFDERELGSKEIYNAQRIILKDRNVNNEYWEEFKEVIRKIIG